MERTTFIDALQHVYLLGEQNKKVQIRDILSVLSKKGIEALLVVFSIPIPIPGLSNIFGVILAFLSFQFAFGNSLWLPEKILDQTIEGSHLQEFTKKAMQGARMLQQVLRPRFPIFITHPVFKKLTATLICLLSFIVAMPIPIPLTNILFATPVLMMSLGLLEDDGLLILVGYCLFLFDVLVVVLMYSMLT